MTSSKALLARKKEAQRVLARRNFSDFVAYTFPRFAWNWHHKVLCDVLHKAATFQKDWRKVIIVTPPRHGKSELVSRRLPAYMMGRYPEMETIQWCYSGTLAEKMGRDTIRILESPEFLELFPDFRFGDKKTNSEISTEEGGTYITLGRDGGATGRGANLVVVDDPIKNRKEAESEDIRNKIWDSFQDDLMTRLEYPYAVVVTMTRWHPDDLVGRLLQREPGEWKVIHLPLIADYDSWNEPWPDYDPRKPGEPLWPGVRVKGKIDAEELDIELPTEEELAEEIIHEFNVKKESNPHGTNSLHQGRPTTKEGSLFDEDTLLEYNSDPVVMAQNCTSIFLSIDCNFKNTNTGSAAALVVVGLRKDGKIVVLDAKWGRWKWTKLKEEAIKMGRLWPQAKVLIEAKANGDALIDELKALNWVVIPFDPGNDSKESRIHHLSDIAEAGDLYFPAKASWKEALVTLFTGFPTAEFDDPLDAITQAALKWKGRKGAMDHLKRILGYEK